jgi:hypothetical protein
LPVILLFFVVGAADGIAVAGYALLDATAGAARAVAFFLIFFVLAEGGGTMGGRAGGTMMTLILLPADSAM